MNMIRLYTGKDGQTHIEELDLATHPELTTMQATKGIISPDDEARLLLRLA